TLAQRQGLFRDTDNSDSAVSGYCKIAENYEITPSQLALAWCDQIDGVTSTIIGATTIEQLTEDIDAFSLNLPTGCLEEVMQIFKQYPTPF
ncbi:MAG: aldo/keto reductase, partial [Pseudomonadota bacterium]